jgi:tousled-like kinase
MQVFHALKYLNEQPKAIIHYDLKPGNILFHNHEVKITDFGLSKIQPEGNVSGIELTSQGAGTYWYLPPECLNKSKDPVKIDSSVDVWSAGVILYQMLYGKRPFNDELSQEALLRNVMNRGTDWIVKFPVNHKPSITEPCKDFIRKCLAEKPCDRPSILQIFDEPYLKPPPGKVASSSRNK